MRASTDVVVIGAGVVGASVALELQRLGGFRTTVVDANRGPGEGSTSFSSGLIRTCYSVPDVVKASYECRHLWRSWGEHVRTTATALPMYREPGGVALLTKNSREFIQHYSSIATALNIPTEILDLSAAKAKLGKLGWDLDHVYEPRNCDDDLFDQPLPNEHVEGALWMPQTGYVSDPRLATETIAQAAQREGATFRYRCEVSDILKHNGRVSGVRLSDGSAIDAPLVVNCAGPYSSFVTKLAFPAAADNDMKMTTRALRAEVAFVSAPKGVDLERDGVVGFDFDVGVYFRPEVGNRWLIGSSDPPCDPHEYVDSADHLRALGPLGLMWKHNVYRMALRSPTLEIPSAKAAQGVVAAYDLAPDWTPIIDKSSLDGFYMAIGTSGNCFKIAPVMGSTMARLIQFNENGGDSDIDDVTVGLPLTQWTLNAKTFSRLRAEHDTSNSVVG
jgi:sarcosine oxidase subunit beta